MKALAILTSLFGAFSLSASASSWMHYDQSNSPLPSNSVTATLNDGAISWVGTDEGLVRFNGTDWEVYTSETSQLPNNHVQDIHKDNQGNTWIATYSGVLKINLNSWEVIDMSNSPIQSNQIRSIATAANNTVWFGTWGNGLISFDGQSWELFDTQNSDIPSNGIFEVSVDNDQNIWVGTFNGGVSKFDGQTWTTYNTSNSELPNNNVRDITIDHSGIVWFGTDDGLARKTPSGHWDVFTSQELGHAIHTVHDGIQVGDGHLYFATDGGLVEFESFNYTVYTLQNSSLQTNNLRCISQDHMGNLWIGTGNNGVTIFSPESTLSVDEDLPTNFFEPYPNPTTENTILDLNSDLGEDFEVMIHNSMGQMVYRNKVKNFSSRIYPIELDDFPPGYFSVSIISNGNVDTKRVLRL
ncbi:MAG: T9SS type A sorting domain-containing protein [Flavobacteriales bacterium]|nr:T9SS type A sorting domain-containing protein [Flavobacteriales bacterium]